MLKKFFFIFNYLASGASAAGSCQIQSGAKRFSLLVNIKYLKPQRPAPVKNFVNIDKKVSPKRFFVIMARPSHCKEKLYFETHSTQLKNVLTGLPGASA